jgi:hypothetical protein
MWSITFSAEVRWQRRGGAAELEVLKNILNREGLHSETARHGDDI